MPRGRKRSSDRNPISRSGSPRHSDHKSLERSQEDRDQSIAGQHQSGGATELLNNIFTQLSKQKYSPEDMAYSKTSPLGAVCHSWALYGAASDKTCDPQWAYIYASPFLKEKERKLFLSTTLYPEPKGAKLNDLLHQLKKLRSYRIGKDKNENEKIHKKVLEVVAKAAGLECLKDSDLTLKVYWDQPRDKMDSFMYRHFELEWRDEMCIKKFNGGQVGVTSGESVVEPVENQIVCSTSIFIDPNNLSTSHLKYLAEIQTELNRKDAEPPPTKRQKQD